jgi:amino acid permease
MFFKHRINRVSVQIGFISFVIGHLLFLSYLFLQDDILDWRCIGVLDAILWISYHIAHYTFRQPFDALQKL